MKRCSLIAVVVLSVFGLVASASAEENNRRRDENNGNNNSNGNNNNSNSSNNNNNKKRNVKSQSQSESQGSQNQRPFWQSLSDYFGTKNNKKHQDPNKLDPGRPDGRVEVPDVATPPGPLPPSRPGYVFVNGHWERIKAGSAIGTSADNQQQLQLDPGRPDGRVPVPDVASPTGPLPPSRPGYVFVNGHWERAQAGSATVTLVENPQQTQLDPGRPDGRVPVPDVATPTGPLPPSRPGYVFVNGHWERIKAGSATVTLVENPQQTQLDPGRPDGRVQTPDVASPPGPLPPSRPGYVFANGHWERIKAGSATPPPVAHISTVTNTNPPGTVRPVRDTTIYGTGPGLYDYFKIHDPKFIWDSLPPWGFESAPPKPTNPRDHRGAPPAPAKKTK